jgi:hypothetical protein
LGGSDPCNGGAWGPLYLGRSAGPPQARPAPGGQRPVQRWSVGATLPGPQRRAAPSKAGPLGGSDPCNGGAWGPLYRGRSAGPPPARPAPRGSDRATVERGATLLGRQGRPPEQGGPRQSSAEPSAVTVGATLLSPPGIDRP